MPILFQHRIYRSDLKHNPDVKYLFGDNEARKGLGGQARECRGEPNAIGIATKIKPSRGEDAFWSDADYERCAAIVKSDFEPALEHLKSGGILVCPSDGLGTGLSELSTRAPRLLALIREYIQQGNNHSSAIPVA